LIVEVTNGDAGELAGGNSILRGEERADGRSPSALAAKGVVLKEFPAGRRTYPREIRPARPS
jgi:hypothetical protein